MTLSAETVPAVRNGLVNSMASGFLGRCPHCGKGGMFGRYLKVRPDCEECGLEMHHHQADDLPPYVVIFIVGHIVGYGLLKTETEYDLPLWFQLGFWPIVTLVMAVALLQPVKGAVVGLQYALGMHGFSKLPNPVAATSIGPEEVPRGSIDGHPPEPAPGHA